MAKYRKTKKERKILKDDQLGDSKENKYIKVSLASFNDKDYDDESAVERSILQQLFYSRNKRELPNSTVERTNKSSIGAVIGMAILLALFVLSLTLMSIELALFCNVSEKDCPLSLFLSILG